METITLTLDEFRARALRAFEQMQIGKGDNGNWFFEVFGVGNTGGAVHMASERFHYYETLLGELSVADRKKFEKIHKGTPYYFLGWTAFDMGSYEKALFYIDAAVSEDQKNEHKKCCNLPAAKFLKLDGGGAADRVVLRIRGLLQDEIERFNKLSELDVKLGALLNGLISRLLDDTRYRSCLGALYTFILEFKDRYQELTLRCNAGGSIQPALTHLFKGGLVFETLLKKAYPPIDTNGDKRTLAKILKSPTFLNDFGLEEKDIHTSASGLGDILKNAGNETGATFSTTARLRNTTGHDLARDDIFGDPENYKLLFETEVDAIFYLAEKKFATG